MTPRPMPDNPLQRLLKERQHVPDKKFHPKRMFPLVHQPFADSAEIPLVSLCSAVQVVPETSSKSRQPAPHMPAGNLIALQQIANEPPFQRRRGKQRAI